MANVSQEYKKSVRDEFAEKFISILESDKPMQWVQGWANSGFSRPYNGGSNRAYNGLNRFILSFEAMERGWTDPRFFTFKQASDEGYSVKKGEKSTRVEYWAVWDSEKKKSISISEYNKILKSDLDEDRYRLYSKAAYVFNAHQLDNIELLPVVNPQHDFQENRLAESVLDCLSTNMDVPIHYGGDRAYYSPTGDYVQMPRREAFFTAEDYYSTLGHELSHATGAASRLNRPMDSLYANAESYALEELRAEIASTYFCAELGVNISEKALESHQAYVASWLKAIKTGRSKYATAVLCVQNLDNFKKEVIYDILSNIHYVYVLASNNANSLTTEVVCKMAGSYYEKEKSYSQSNSTSVSTSFKQQQVLRPEDLNQLGDDAVLLITNHGYVRTYKEGSAYYKTEPFKSQYERIIAVNQKVMVGV